MGSSSVFPISFAEVGTLAVNNTIETTLLPLLLLFFALKGSSAEADPVKGLPFMEVLELITPACVLAIYLDVFLLFYKILHRIVMIGVWWEGRVVVMCCLPSSFGH